MLVMFDKKKKKYIVNIFPLYPDDEGKGIISLGLGDTKFLKKTKLNDSYR